MRAALVGNVDAWLLFSLGAEDMDDAWRIVNGEVHGWHPQDLVDGLRPHEVAMAVSGDLLKLGTLSNPPVDPHASALKEGVTSSSRRYAQPEDSEASPWLVGQEEVEGSLRSLSKGPRTRQELVGETLLPPEKLDASLSRAASAGDLVLGASDRRFHLTARGSVHLKALENRRNEGEDHVETLTELAMFLEARGIALSVPKQVAGVLLPDGQFQWGDAIYNVEVECLTVTKAAGQVVRNVKKARTAGYRVLIVLPERSGVPKTMGLLNEVFPELRLWSDGVGLVWKNGRASFQSHRVPGVRIWPFLDSEAEFGTQEEVPPSNSIVPLRTDTDPLLGQARVAVRALIDAGRKEATPQEILAALSPTGRLNRTEQHIGRALSLLGLRSRRVKSKGTRFRLYELLSIDSAAASRSRSSGWDPVSEPDGGTEPTECAPHPPNRAPGSPMENARADPTGPTVPDD
jgi:hypothetical protein